VQQKVRATDAVQLKDPVLDPVAVVLAVLAEDPVVDALVADVLAVPEVPVEDPAVDALAVPEVPAEDVPAAVAVDPFPVLRLPEMIRAKRRNLRKTDV